jgi:putative sigma-54 modulation protein
MQYTVKFRTKSCKRSLYSIILKHIGELNASSPFLLFMIINVKLDYSDKIGAFMEVRIVARHFDLTPSLELKIQEKVTYLLSHFKGLIDCVVTLYTNNKDKNHQHHAEIKVHLRNSKIICAKAEGADMYSTIEEITKKMDRQLVNHKNIVKNHKCEAPKYISANMQSSVASDELDLELEDEII